MNTEKINKERQQLLLDGKVAISHNGNPKSPDVELIRELTGGDDIYGDSDLYWIRGGRWQSGRFPRKYIRKHPVSWFFEEELSPIELELKAIEKSIEEIRAILLEMKQKKH